MESSYIKAQEIISVIPVSITTAYRIIRELNRELERQGYRVIRGKCPRRYFYERYHIQQEVSK